MRLALLFLLFTTLLLSPAVSGAQSKTTEAPKDTKVAGEQQPVKDSWITSKTKMALIADKRTKARQIKVETQAGVVTLRGKVASAEERGAAEEIAKGVSGVKLVNNALQVVPAIERKTVDVKDSDVKKNVVERLGMDQQLKTADITVRADNGMVTLIGTVPDVRAKSRAADVARKVPGVRAVRNELQLKS
jgi:hyperosmotically inducible periplasmic protein